MASHIPTQCEYVAVVSEWQSREGAVGNAYPFFNLTKNEAVADPQDEFPNPGAVFLPNRTDLNTWDFILLRPGQNIQYSNINNRQCYYIPVGRPEVLNNPNRVENVAVVLDHSRFDLNSATRQLLNPRHSVTPIFFVKVGESILGPLLRDAVHLNAFDDVERIHWRPARDDGIVYEFTYDDLAKKGVRLAHYAHPEPKLNRVLETPLLIAYGPVRQATSARPLDTLADAALIEWYLQRCASANIPSQQIASIISAFRGKPGDDPAIQAARLKKIEKELVTHLAFVEQRERFARHYLETPQGQQRVRELIEQAIQKRASEIQAEVDKRQSLIAARRAELEQQFQQAQREHEHRLDGLKAESDRVEQRIAELKNAAGQLQESLSADVRQLATRLHEHIPVFAAVLAARLDNGAPAALPARSPGREIAVEPQLRPVPPSAPIRPIVTERKLVDDLHLDLARRGLHFARDFVANVYTCLKAEPLNLIIGPPGYGKSMLVAALARSLGHSDALLRIAVRRSWSEDRYLLGFYDSFHGRYDPGATGLVSRMIQADLDWRQQRTGVYVVLLDEFNLAAPEYYFSQLLQALPSDDPVREITLYDPNGAAGGHAFPSKLTLTPNLRFWGTINYDETTERLSPRTLDRTGMIFLGAADVKATVDEDLPPMSGVAASDLFEKYFRTGDQCPDDRWDLLEDVIDCLRNADAALGPRIELSPRVRAAVKRYLANSVDVLTTQAAVDFVVQQRILPVIRGRGEEFAARMNRLCQLLADANLPRSAAHVEEALRRSKQQFGELDFLTY